MPIRALRISAAAAAFLAALTLVGCGDKKEEKKVATQVAAKVDAEEVSVHQINNVLSKTSGIPPERVADAKREILNKLVDQQLAVNKAVEQKIDRTPEVMMAIEAARREILARAYLEKLAAGQSKPSPAEIKKYYDEHPQLFAQRRVYNLQELTVQKKDGLLPALQEKVAGAKSLEEVAAWLKGQDVKFGANAGARAAEQIPLELLPKLHETKDGQTLVVQSSQAILVMKVLASQAAPVDENQAAPRIAQFLGNQRTTEFVAAELKKLREAAKIEYVGEFAGAAPAAKPAEKADAKPAPAGPATGIEKGAAALK